MLTFVKFISALWHSAAGLRAQIPLGVSSSPESTASVASTTCQQLHRTLGASTVQTQSSGPEYALAANAAWSSFNSEVNYQPTCIVFVNSTKDVQTTMKFIYENNVDYAVQAGGHTGMTGWNTINNGVLISFMNMNDTSYNPETDTITIQPGIRWGDAVSILQPYGVAPVGGRVSDVGTGLLLGGGLSYLSPSQGYASDNYVALDVVLVDGTMVTATANNKYSDLFKALKGGGNRFGIVTRYEVRAVHTGTEQDKSFWGGLFLYPNSSIEAVLAAVAHFAHNTNDINAVMATDIVTTWSNGSADLSIQVELFYNGTAAAFYESFAEFHSIPYMSSSIGPLSYLDIDRELSFPGGFGSEFAGSVLAGAPAGSNPTVEDYLETYRLFNNFTTTYTSSQLAMTMLSFTPVLESQIRISYEKGGNVISPPKNQGGFNEVLFYVRYGAGVTKPLKSIEQGRQFWITHTPNTPGLPLFLNEVDASQNVLATYGEYQFLKQVYAKYDPTRFNVRHTLGPLGL